MQYCKICCEEPRWLPIANMVYPWGKSFASLVYQNPFHNSSRYSIAILSSSRYSITILIFWVLFAYNSGWLVTIVDNLQSWINPVSWANGDIQCNMSCIMQVLLRLSVRKTGIYIPTNLWTVNFTNIVYSMDFAETVFDEYETHAKCPLSCWLCSSTHRKFLLIMLEAQSHRICNVQMELKLT